MNTGDNEKLTFWGASPIVFLMTILFSIPIVLVNYLYKPVFEINLIPYNILLVIASLLLCIGIPIYISTVKMLKAAYKRHELLTRGVFSVCRNPLFAAVIFLLLPGILLFFRSWLLLTIPCFIYVMFKIFIHREEYLMEKEFGQEYLKYKENTSALFPKIWKYKK